MWQLPHWALVVSFTRGAAIVTLYIAIASGVSFIASQDVLDTHILRYWMFADRYL